MDQAELEQWLHARSTVFVVSPSIWEPSGAGRESQLGVRPGEEICIRKVDGPWTLVSAVLGTKTEGFLVM